MKPASLGEGGGEMGKGGNLFTAERWTADMDNGTTSLQLTVPPGRRESDCSYGLYETSQLEFHLHSWISFS